ncbi:hypothetical protein IID04_04165 [PVC group bacterium]|nr:hypothetical protein [PVC group bacterium]
MKKIIRLTVLVLGSFLIVVGACKAYLNTDFFISSFTMMSVGGFPIQNSISTVLLSELYILINFFGFVCGIGLIFNTLWGKKCMFILYAASFLINLIIDVFEITLGEPMVMEYFSKLGIKYESESFLINALIDVFFLSMCIFSVVLIKQHRKGD